MMIRHVTLSVKTHRDLGVPSDCEYLNFQP